MKNPGFYQFLLALGPILGSPEMPFFIKNGKNRKNSKKSLKIFMAFPTKNSLKRGFWVCQTIKMENSINSR